jgi:O-antigen/teichoic acid export membrane protein
VKESRKILKWATVILAVVTLCLALYIMWNRLGLSPDYDFGAGAYFYADDPAIQDLSERAAYTTSVPKWIHYALFFVWGALMWLLWKWVDRRK